DPPTRIGGSAGRLVRVGADGAARQFILPGDGPGASLLARAQDVAVDERSGSVYLVADGQLWQATLPPTTTAIASAAVGHAVGRLGARGAGTGGFRGGCN